MLKLLTKIIIIQLLTKSTAFAGFDIGDKTYLLEETGYTFYADYPELTLSGAIGACNVSGGLTKNKRKTKKIQ